MDNIVCAAYYHPCSMVLGQFFCRVTGSAAQLEPTACARCHGPELISKKCLEKEIFVGTNFRELAFDRENCKISASRKFPAIQ